MFQAIEIDGEPYWDGGYAGNPTSRRWCARATPGYDPGADQPARAAGGPRTATEILNRLNEISFNSPLMKELRMIALLRQVADPGTARARAGPGCARIGSRPNDDRARRSSKLNAEWAFVPC